MCFFCFEEIQILFDKFGHIFHLLAEVFTELLENYNSDSDILSENSFKSSIKKNNINYFENISWGQENFDLCNIYKHFKQD